MTPAPSPLQTGRVKDLRWSSGRVWVINGLPRSGQLQMANRLARGAKTPPMELKPEDHDGRPAWSMDTISAERAYAGLTRPADAAATGHSVLYMTSPLLAPAALSESVTCNHIHMVRDPRQLFAAYARRAQTPELVRLARAVVGGRHLPQMQPLWDSDVPGLDLLAGGDGAALRARLSASDPSRLYSVFYYLWLLSLLRNLRNGALCVELRMLATTTAARSDLIELFAAFGLKVAFGANRIDQYSAHDIAGDLGLPNVPWGSRLAHTLRGSEFALAEARVGRQLENAVDQIDLWIAEEDAAALTAFIDPAYSLLLLPFVRPWFAKKKSVTYDGGQNSNAMQRVK